MRFSWDGSNVPDESVVEFADYTPWDTAYSLWLIAAVLYGIGLGFGGEVLLGWR